MLLKHIRSLTRRLGSDELIRHSGILFAGMAAAHACSLVFQMAVSRALPPEEYALLAAFMGVLLVLQMPLSTMTAAAGHYSSLLVREGRAGDVRRLTARWLVVAGVPALLLGAAGLAFSAPLASSLHLARPGPVMIAALTLPALFLLPVLTGAAQGRQQFGWNAASSASGGLARAALGAGFVWFMHPTCGWAMLGHGLGLYTAAAVLLAALLAGMRHERPTGAALPSMRYYVLQSFLVQASYALLMTADVVLVKHFLPADTDFAYAATLGRLVVFLCSAIVVAMFPKVASHGAATAEQWSVFRRAMVYTAVCAALAVAGCALFTGLLLRVMFGIRGADGALIRMTVLMSAVMGVNALVYVAVQFLLARRRFRQASVVVAAAAVYVGGSLFFHASALSIAILSGSANLLALAALAVVILRDAAKTGNQVAHDEQ